MEMSQADWVMRCIRGQHSKGATNWIMTHEGQIWARDLASKVALGSRSVLHSRLLILSLQSGTPAFAAPHMHAHTHITMCTSHILCAEFLCPSRLRVQPVVIDWIKRLKINVCLWPWVVLLLYALRRESVDFGCPLHSILWPSTYPPTSYRAIEFPHAETPECRGCG